MIRRPMRPRIRRPVVATLVLVLTWCTRPPTADLVTPVAGASGHARIEGRRLVETHELRTRPNTFLHEALRALRPEFFLTGQGELHVYLDAAYVGGLEGLGSLRTDNVVSVRYFGESDPGIARFQRGGSPGPVLSVVTLLGTSGR